MAEKKDEKKDAAKPAAAAAGAEVPAEAAAAKKKKLIIIGAAVGVLAVGGGGGAFFMLKGKKDAHKTEAVPEAEAHSKDEQGKTEEKKSEHAASPEAKDGHAASETKAGAKDETGKPGASPTPLNIGFGKTMTLPPFHLNLGNPIDNRYVRLEIAIEYGDSPDIEGELKARMPQLRDAVVSVTRKKSREFLLSADGTDQLRLEIRNRINQYMKKPIDNVYVTDILIE